MLARTRSASLRSLPHDGGSDDADLAASFTFLAARLGNGDIVATANGEGRIRIWSVRDGKLLADFDSIFGGVLGRISLRQATSSWIALVAGSLVAGVVGLTVLLGGPPS